MIPKYIEDIKTALYNKCYFPALALTLTLPDICGMAEYPKEDVGKRYIRWIDKYTGEHLTERNDIHPDNPSISGEIIYNLRNTFLHQGVPNIYKSKIKEEKNQVDKFVLIFGGTPIIHKGTVKIETPIDEVGFKAIFIDATYLCECLCDSALKYYLDNKEKFEFQFYAVSQEDLMQAKEESSLSDWMKSVLNEKLKSTGSTLRVDGVNEFKD